MKYLIDTNTIIYIIQKRPPETIERLLRVGAQNCFISTVTEMELHAGVADSSDPARNEAAIKEMIASLGGVVSFDRASAIKAASMIRLAKDTGRQGWRRRLLDIQIASQAAAHGFQLVTHNGQDVNWDPDVAGIIEDWA